MTGLLVINDEKLTPELIEQLPASLKQIVVGIGEAVERLDKQINKQREKINDEIKRNLLAEQLDLEYTTNRLTRARTTLKTMQRQRDAFAAGYVEAPAQSWGKIWNLDDIPLRCLRAMKHAQDTGLFDRFQIVRDQGRDPWLVGIIGRRAFLVSWWTA